MSSNTAPTPRAQAPIKSDIGWSTTDRIGVFGRDLVNDLIGKVNLGDMGFLEITGRLPTERESVMFNAISVTLVEHGMTPSAIAARMTYTGAPESMQAAMAAGLLGLGSVFVGSTETSARMLTEAMATRAPGQSLEALAEATVDRMSRDKQQIPGVGHPIHKPIDPRTPRLFSIAREQGFHGDYIALMQLIARTGEQRLNRPLPINATGAIGAICCEMGIPWQACRGIAVMSRAVGLIGHLIEESRQPTGRELWRRVDDEASAHMKGRFSDET